MARRGSFGGSVKVPSGGGLAKAATMPKTSMAPAVQQSINMSQRTKSTNTKVGNSSVQGGYGTGRC